MKNKITIQVSFITSHPKHKNVYNYNASQHPEVELGDIVIVHTRFGLSLAQVESFSDSSFAGPEIIDIVSDANDSFKQLKKDFFKKDIIEEIHRLIAENDERMQYEALFESDPRMKELSDDLYDGSLEEYQNTHPDNIMSFFTKTS